MSLINDIINRHVDDRKGQYVFISRQQIAAICRDYADNAKPKPEKKKRSITHFARGYRIGYKHRSDIEYNEAMRLFWLRYVAPETEKQDIDLKDLEIVEPEVIIK